MHSIRTDFGFNLLHSASKLKRGVIEGTGGCFWFSVFVDFSSPIFFAVNLDGDVVRELFSVKFILHSLWYTSLVYVFLNIVFQCDLVFVLCWFFFSQPDINNTWITGHIHRSIVDKIDSTSEYVEMLKKIYIINYIGLHSFVKCDQKNLFTVPSIDQ